MIIIKKILYYLIVSVFFIPILLINLLAFFFDYIIEKLYFNVQLFNITMSIVDKLNNFKRNYIDK